MLDELIQEAEAGKTVLESRALRRQTLDPSEIEAAVARAGAHPDASSYLVLMALRRAAPSAYDALDPDVRARILSDALRRVTYLNDFGYLNTSESHDAESGLTMVGLGPAAVPHLVPLLDNREPAPLFGSEEATLARVHGYRRADFAFRFLSKILGREPTFEATPLERDPQIANLRAELVRTP